MRFEKGFWYEYQADRADECFFTRGTKYLVLDVKSEDIERAGKHLPATETQVFFRDNNGTKHAWSMYMASREFSGTGFSQPNMTLDTQQTLPSNHLDVVARATALGAKYDGGKLLFRPLMNGLAAALKVVAAVLTYGAKKYQEDSWQEVPDGKRRYENALYRHQNDRALEDFDRESGLLHSAHIACNALFILWFEILEHLNKGKSLDELTTFNDPTSKH